MTNIDTLNTSYSDELAIALLTKRIGNDRLADIIALHNTWHDSLRDDISADEDGAGQVDMYFSEFAYNPSQINVYKVHDLTTRMFEKTSDMDRKIIFAILAIETSVFLVDGISERELGITRARFGAMKNFLHTRKIPVHYRMV